MQSIRLLAIAALLSANEAEAGEDALADVMTRLEGAYSTVVMTKKRVYAFRDPAGVRPLSLGMIGDSYCVASETCASTNVGASFTSASSFGSAASVSPRATISDAI